VLVAESLARAGRGDDAAVHAMLREALVFAPDRVSLFEGAAGLLVVLDAVDPRHASLAGARARLRAAVAASLAGAPPGDPADVRSFDLISGVAGRAIALGTSVPEALPALRAFAHAFADSVQTRLASDDENVATVNLGVAHGVPGVLAALNAAAPDDRALARRYVELLLRCSHTVGGAHRWGAVWRAAERPSARRAWCYQTVGVAAVLDDRARLDGDDALRALAANALAAVLDDPEPEEDRWDAALCHGRAGVASIAWRFTGAGERFARYAARLAQGVLNDFDERAPLGYRSYNLPQRREEDRPNFLDAALGVAQFLVDAATAQERRWLPLFGLLPD
jgi:hypothetical protein